MNEEEMEQELASLKIQQIVSANLRKELKALGDPFLMDLLDIRKKVENMKLDFENVHVLNMLLQEFGIKEQVSDTEDDEKFFNAKGLLLNALRNKIEKVRGFTDWEIAQATQPKERSSSIAFD